MKRVWIGIVVASLLLTGCATPQPAPPPPAPEPVVVPQDLQHLIQYPGETLGVIASWYTGRVSNWEAIRDANPALKPNRLRVGMTVTIPENLVTRHEPMPKDFVKKFLGTSKKSEAKSEAQSEPVKEETGQVESAATAEVDTVEASAVEAGTQGDSPAVSEVTPEPTPQEPEAAAPTPTPVAPPVADAPASKVDSPESAAPTTDQAAPEDNEREKLLDELLN